MFLQLFQKIGSFIKLHLQKLFILFALVPTLLLVVFYYTFQDKIYPGIFVSGIDLSGLTQKEASVKIKKLETVGKIEIIFNNNDFSLNLEDYRLEYSTDQSASLAFSYGREKDLKKRLDNLFLALTKGVNLPVIFTIDNEKLTNYLDQLGKKLNIPYLEAEIIIEKEKVFNKIGQDGQEIDRLQLRKQILDALAYSKNNQIIVPIKNVPQQLTNDDVEELKSRAVKLIGKKLKIVFEYESFIYKDSDLVLFLQPNGKELDYVNNKIKTEIIKISQSINRESQDARFVFENSLVIEFAPAKDGIVVEEEQLFNKIKTSLEILEKEEKNETTINTPVFQTKPSVENTEVNNLGIKELLGFGESYYKGSILSRVHNLSLAAKRLNGLLIKPGESFSFNKAVGEISQATGYQQAYVIKEGRTILDDGGGVCQTSTTFFRAALASGLPILERHQHSYRVSYYEQGTKAGIDAAVYPPGVDLIIRNDTPGHILIQVKNDQTKSRLIFEFYGTKDNRIIEIGEPKYWDAKPAPPPLYQDDPSLPIGIEKQIEKAVPGLKTSFSYKVIKNGEVLQNKTFYSNYRAWQAVYLRGIAPQ